MDCLKVKNITDYGPDNNCSKNHQDKELVGQHPAKPREPVTEQPRKTEQQEQWNLRDKEGIETNRRPEIAL